MTNVHEVAPRIYRINTPVDIGISFNFNQNLIAADEPFAIVNLWSRWFVISDCRGGALRCPQRRRKLPRATTDAAL